jgi:hypothetical protein
MFVANQICHSDTERITKTDTERDTTTDTKTVTKTVTNTGHKILSGEKRYKTTKIGGDPTPFGSDFGCDFGCDLARDLVRDLGCPNFVSGARPAESGPPACGGMLSSL